MTDFTTPATWRFNGSASKDQTSFLLAGHSVKAPRIALFARSVPSSTGSETPSYKVKFVEGQLDASGNPIATRTNAEFSVRWPLNGDPAKAKALLAELAAVLSNSEFISDMIDEQLLPR